MKFLHIADVHLGCRRYNLEERTKDFFRAWSDMIERHAIGKRVDFVLIAGDFFNSRKVDPQAMNHAMIGLEKLKTAGIPVVAIEGNHDQRDAITPHSWLRSLSQWGLLKLLEPVAGDERNPIALKAWNEIERKGSYIDIAGARIFGSHWYGASASAAIGLLADALRATRDENLFNILMLHMDVEGQTNRPIPALPVAKLKELKELTNYVAFGHTHKRFDLDNWAFNPGSLEAVSIDEYREERGGYLVEVEKTNGAFEATVKHVRDYVQRPFQRLSFDVSGAIDQDVVYAGVLDVVKREARAHQPGAQSLAPIIEISLKGQLGFKNSLLELKRLREEAQALTGALHVLIRNQSVPVEYAVAAGLDMNASREERELRIVEDLIARNNLYRDRAREMAALVIKTKQYALSNESPDKIVELIEQNIQPRTEAAKAESADAPEHTPATPSAISAIERNAAIS
ncbi:MAG: exonuclease SbcCD subunit D [Pyrinomonadaceae bacterium]